MTDGSGSSPAGDSILRGRGAQTFVPTPEWIVLAGLSAPAQALYTVLLAHVNRQRDDEAAWPGMDVLADLLGFKHRNSVARYLRELCSIDAVTVEKRRPHSMDRSNLYRVHEVPAEGYVGHRSLASFYAARRAQAPMHTESSVAVHTTAPAATPSEVCKNQTNSTRRSEPDEVTAAPQHASSGDASAAGARSRARELAADDRTKPRVHVPRGFYDPDRSNDGAVYNHLVKAWVAAVRNAGYEPTSGATDSLGAALRADTYLDRRGLVGAVEDVAARAGTDDPEWGWTASPAGRAA